MKTQQILIAVMACAVGVGGYAFLAPKKDDSKELDALKQQLASARSRIEMLEANRSSPSAKPTKPSASGSIDLGLLDDAFPEENEEGDANNAGEAAASEDPMEAIAKIVNSKETRSLMKQFATAMAGQSSPWIKRELGRYTNSLGLSDEQVATLSEKMGAKAQVMAKEFADGLDDESKTVQEYMQEQGERWAQSAREFDDIMQETLTDEQFEQYEREQLVQRAQIIERQAQRELNGLTETLDLTEPQQDQVFGILVQKSPLYDEQMQISNVPSSSATGGGVPGFAVGPTEAAIVGAEAGVVSEGAIIEARVGEVSGGAVAGGLEGEASGAAVGAEIGAGTGAIIGTQSGIVEGEAIGAIAGAEAGVVEGEASGAALGAVDGVEIEAVPMNDVSKEDAIRSVLTPEQVAIYNQSLENPAPRNGGRFGGFPGFGR